MNFAVWAPAAQAVKLELGSAIFSMHRAERGWWRVEQPTVSGQSRYSFIVDDGEPTPDPRSRWQPDGVHRASCAWDTDALGRRPRRPFKPKPLAEAVIYEIHIGTFTPAGTYRGAIEHLPHLRELGVTHLELMPLATFPGERGWGYDGVYFYAPHPAYGTPDDLAAFIDACHEHDLAVLLDVVYNHLGPDGNYLQRFGPYFTSHWKTPWGDAVNYDGAESDEVRAFVIENALMWLRDYGFDGLRLDAVHAIIDARAKHLLEELAERVDALGKELTRDFILIAESDRNDPMYVRPTQAGGYGLDAHWADELHHTLHVVLTGERDGYYSDFGKIEDIARALRAGYVFQGQYSPFRRRGHGRPPTGVRPEQLVVCAQNHDQIGNRALGDRVSEKLPPEKLKMMAALVLLSPFTPLLFQGEEWGARTPFLYFTDHHDELGRAVTEGRRHEFAAFKWQPDAVPDPQARSTFVRSKLRWDEKDEPDRRDLLEWYRQLLKLRREYVGPERADRDVRFDESREWLTLRIGHLLVVANLGPNAQIVENLPTGDWSLALSSGPAIETPDSEMPGWSTTIWTRRPSGSSA
ncbi:MAG TPA: malto-oligosyltrehalose trehalohydrolase [Candidatus Synoicihabitans sp.]|nr:malto-oligosyltrehalose trehalohydrolase [Candidatus Synoicihabitans sp.]